MPEGKPKMETNYTDAHELIKHLEGTIDKSISHPDNKNWRRGDSQGKMNLNYLIWASAELNNAENLERYDAEAKSKLSALMAKIAGGLGSFDLRK